MMTGWQKKELTMRQWKEIQNHHREERSCNEFLMPHQLFHQICSKHCGLNLPADGSLDHQIHCFKDKQLCTQGRELLQTQLSILEKPHADQSQASDSDIEDAYEPDQLLDPDEEDENEDVGTC